MLCQKVAFLKEGRLVAQGTMPELQERLGLGDHLSLVFQDGPAALVAFASHQPDLVLLAFHAGAESGHENRNAQALMFPHQCL